jgi:hypothetical protein
MIKRGSKKAQEVLGMSFSTLFGIIVIIVIISVAFFAIRYFLNLNKCRQVGSFYDDFQDEIDNAWRTGFYQGTFTGAIPSAGILDSGVKYVCVGCIDHHGVACGAPQAFQAIRDELRKENRYGKGQNLYIYPTGSACNGKLAALKLNNINFAEFNCYPVEKGKVSIPMIMGPADKNVTILPG